MAAQKLKTRTNKKITKEEILRLKSSEKKIISKLIQKSFSGKTAKKQQEFLVMENFALAVHVAKKYFAGHDTYRDLVQVASIGLIKAAKKFKATMKVSFASYAVPTIDGEIKHYLRDNAYLLKLPRKYSELGIRLEKYRRDFMYKEGREITDKELAKNLKLKQREISLADDTLRANKMISLDTPLYATGKNYGRESLTTIENILGVSSNIDKMIEREGLREALLSLTPRNRAIIRDHYLRELTQDEISEKYKITQAQVSRILKSSCEILREVMA